MYGVLSEGFYFFAVDVVHSRTSYIRAVAAATRREYAVFGRHVVIARRIIIIIYHIFILLLLLLRVHNNNIMYIYYIRRRHYYYDVLRAAPIFLRPKDALPEFSRRTAAPDVIESSSIILLVHTHVCISTG